MHDSIKIEDRDMKFEEEVAEYILANQNKKNSKYRYLQETTKIQRIM